MQNLDQDIFSLIQKEHRRQIEGVELIDLERRR